MPRTVQSLVGPAPHPDPIRRPAARGPLTEWTIAHQWGDRPRSAPVVGRADPFGDDLQLALYLAYEPHFGDLGCAAEWDPEVVGFRAELERAFVGGLCERVGPPGPWSSTTDVRRAIPELVAADDGPSVSRYMEHHGTLEQMREFVMHRSPYQLKEGDGHTMGVPRLHGAAKQGLVAIQAGEYGADAPGREMHSSLFAATMRALGLDDRPNAYLDRLPASAFLVSNVISMFGLNRRWRHALVGHLAVFEMTSVEPMGRYARALERLGAPPEARRFYDVHVLADAEHEHMALAMAGAAADAAPDAVGDIVFGARAAIAAEHEFAGTLLRSWPALAAAG